jgi:hypothetical protein
MALHDSVSASNQDQRHCIDSIPTMDLRLGHSLKLLNAYRTIRTRIEMHGF